MCCEASVGIDLAHIPSLRATLDRFGTRFTRRVFTKAEIEYCERQHDPAPSYAARFAAKEATIKAIGTGGFLAAMRAVEVSPASGESPPTLMLNGELAARIAPAALSLSLSHDGDYAVGTVLAFRNGVNRRDDG